MGIRLCVNVDHIATLRQARGGAEPDLLEGARLCEESGAHGITVHLREDRRHIQDRDVALLRDTVRGRFNLEMALSDDIIAIALAVHPDQVTLVPERREELTTEGGIDVVSCFDRLREITALFRSRGIVVSYFIEPDRVAVEYAARAGAECVELHTGAYCNAPEGEPRQRELGRIVGAAEHVRNAGLALHAGHGLNSHNVGPVAAIEGMAELNIGHSIISRSIIIGLAGAVREILANIERVAR